MLDKLKRVDWMILVILLLMMGFSTILIRSAIQNQGPAYDGYEMKNLVFYCLGFIALSVTALFDYRLLIRAAVYLYVLGNGLLVAVYLFAPPLNGAKGWFQFSIGPMGLNFQPAELVKLLLILMLAFMLARRNGESLGLLRDVLPSGLVIFIPFVLVMIQPDLGNAIIYVVIYLGMMWIGNIKYNLVLIGLGAVVFSVIVGMNLYTAHHDKIEEVVPGHWVDRIDTFLDPDSASFDERYQVENARTAIGSGGLQGTGYMEGQSTRNGFVPFPYSDSIFVVVGEEFGFVGASVLLLLYFLLLYRMILISIQAQDLAGSYIIIGIVSMFVFQIFENIGMMMGIMPLTGITLPFISYGGTSLLINMMAIGVVLSIRMNQEKPSMFA